jgi:hypothetical protein
MLFNSNPKMYRIPTNINIFTVSKKNVHGIKIQILENNNVIYSYKYGLFKMVT